MILLLLYRNCSWQDINIHNSPEGNPELFLCASAAGKADEIDAKNFHISISHEREYACAMVILES